MRAKPLCILLFALAAAFLANRAFAHPMGNFSVNHYSKIEVESDRIVLHYVLDLAEIPAFQEMQNAGISAGSAATLSQQAIESRGKQLGQSLTLEVNGRRLPLEMTSSSAIFPPGAGGLPTMKMGFTFEAGLPPGTNGSSIRLHYADENYEGHAGWKEIVAIAGTGRILQSSVPASDRSAQLTNYPSDLLNSPPQDLEASIELALPMATSPGTTAQEQISLPSAPPLSAISKPAPPQTSHSATQRHPELDAQRAVAPVNASAPSPVELSANRQQTPRSSFTELMATQHVSLWFLLTAALIAVGLGALHALEPGHGKTIVAAYLVGSRGTARHALLLGLIVTASHTAGVVALGAVTLYASRYIVPEKLYPWLGLLSGLTIAALGAYMFLRRITGSASDHAHGPNSRHGHWPFARSEENAPQQTETEATRLSAQPSLGQLFTLGITGGIVPCPAALVVLLSAISLHRIGLGLLLIVAFSCGLSVVLIAFGMLMVYAGRLVARLNVEGPITRRWLPSVSSAFVTILGLALVAQAVAAMHLAVPHLSSEGVGPFLFVIGLGLVLGMRHSTDADHVVAISTIVSRQRSIRGAALIGSIWGLGHTITVFAVGALILLFGVEIPPRIGLSMEFCVAVMLVLLGVLNLTGVMRRVVARFTPTATAVGAIGVAAFDGRGASRMNWLARSAEHLGAFQAARPLVVGLVHGLAGSAAVALLVLSTIHDPLWATAYLLVFGAGTLIGMTMMTVAISVPLAASANRSAKLSQYFGVASGMASLCFGSFLVYQLGFLGGLFTAHPHWTPQ